MKLKNIMKDVRQLRVDGQIIEVQPGKTIEIESTKVIYDKVVFKLIEIQKRKEKEEEPIKLEEDK